MLRHKTSLNKLKKIENISSIFSEYFYLAIKMKEILIFATAWMDLERTMLSEISQSEKDKYHVISLICGI